MKRPKLKDFSLPKSIDLTGEKAYNDYRIAKKEYINNLKKNKQPCSLNK